MRAWEQNSYGDASVVRLAQVTEPVVRAGEVLIAPVAVGVNSGDVRIMEKDLTRSSTSRVTARCGIFARASVREARQHS